MNLPGTARMLEFIYMQIVYHGCLRMYCTVFITFVCTHLFHAFPTTFTFSHSQQLSSPSNLLSNTLSPQPPSPPSRYWFQPLITARSRYWFQSLLSPQPPPPSIVAVPIFPHLDHSPIFSLEHLENDFASYF